MPPSRPATEDFFEERLSDDFLFSAPPDPKLDRDGYFERCWPGAGRGQGFDFVRLIESGDEVVVTYESDVSGGGRGRKPDLDGREQVEAIYRQWTETDQNVFYIEHEQLAVGDSMIASRGTFYEQIPGAVLVAEGLDADEGAVYLAKSRKRNDLALRRPLPADRRGRLGVRAIGARIHPARAGRRAHVRASRRAARSVD